MEVLAVLFVLGMIGVFTGSKSKATPKGSGAIIGRGRSPAFYDIMEEEHAEFKAKLEADAKAGKMYQRSKPQSLESLINKVPIEYDEVPASEVLEEFKKYEANGYS